jgi:protein-S-isoprenylcysteine O-methyltransferase Ste14
MLVLLLRWLVLISWFFWILVYWRGGLAIAADILHALRQPPTRWDAALLIVMTAGTGVITLAILVGCLGWMETPGSSPVTGFGTLLALSGIAGTFYCRHYLAQAWTARTQVDADHKLVETGPYGLARHPIYTVAIVLYLGLGLAFPVWWNALAVGIVILSYILKTYDEDAYLQQHLPGYAEYARRVPWRLLPRLW